MASATFTPYLSHTSYSSSLSSTIVPIVYVSLSTSQISFSRNPTIRFLTGVPHLGPAPFSPWNGLRKHGFSTSLQSLRLEKRKKCKGKGVFASLFGVGAPEALVIGVVALLVFGPKGLAEVTKNLGKTLRAFQPTIRELQEVSREFKSTLEKEIGLDELRYPAQGNYTSNTANPSLSPSPADTLQNSQLTATTPDITTEDSQATATTPAISPEDSQVTATTPAVSLEDSQETTAAPAFTMEDSQPTVDPTNGSASSKAYSSEDILKLTEEQLKASASLQQTEQPPSPMPPLDKPETEI